MHAADESAPNALWEFKNRFYRLRNDNGEKVITYHIASKLIESGLKGVQEF